MMDMRSIQIICVTHGSRGNTYAGHDERIAKQFEDMGIQFSFLVNEPYLEDVIRNKSKEKNIYIIPYFLSKGYSYKNKLIPSLLRCLKEGWKIYVAPPIGELTSLPDNLMNSLKSYTKLEGHKYALALIAHGTMRDKTNRNVLEKLKIRLCGYNYFREVGAFYIEEEPQVKEINYTFEDLPVVAVPMLFSNGNHLHDDVYRSLTSPMIHVTSSLLQLLDHRYIVDSARTQAKQFLISRKKICLEE